MSCCGSSCSRLPDPKGIACALFRLTFGTSIALIGLSHYGNVQEFSGFVATGLGPIAPFGMLWGYLLPGLMVTGGILLATGICVSAAAVLLGLALGSIVVGMLLKPLLGGIPLPDVMPATINAYVYLFAYIVAVQCASCCGSCTPEKEKVSKKK